MYRHLIRVSIVFLLAIPAFTQVQTTDKRTEKFLGGIVGGLYKNEFFGFRLSKPAEMYVLTEDEKAGYKRTGSEILSAGVEGNRAAWEKAATAEVVIFSLAMTEPGMAGTASLNVGALRQPDAATSKMVCDAAKTFLLRNPNIKVASDTAPKRFASRDFSRLELTVSVENEVIFVRYYVTIVRGHSLTFVITYLKKEDLDKFEKVLGTLEFFE